MLDSGDPNVKMSLRPLAKKSIQRGGENGQTLFVFIVYLKILNMFHKSSTASNDIQGPSRGRSSSLTRFVKTNKNDS